MNRSLFVVVLAASLAALLLVAGAVHTQAAGAVIHCQAPQNVVCQISDGDGVQAVRVRLATGQGPVTVVNQTYSCAPSASVSWDPIVPDFEIEVVDCGGETLVAAGFDGLLHAPVGGAELRLEGGQLRIEGFGASGPHGGWIELESLSFPVHRAGASQWDALLLPAEPPVGGLFAAHVYTDVLMAPASAIQFTNEITQVIVYASFAGSDYEVALYNGDDLVYEQGGIPSGGQHIWVPGWFCAAFDEILDCAPRLIFGVDPATRAGYWEVQLPEPIEVGTPGERFQADRIRLMEEEGIGYLFAAKRIALLGNLLPSLTIFDENVLPPLDSQLALPLVYGGGLDDPLGLEALTDFLEAPAPPGETLRINDSLSVRVVGPGSLIEQPVVEPEPGGEPTGVRAPVEPGDVPVMRQALRVFNTANKMEYEILVEGPLLAQLHQLALLNGQTGAHPGADSFGADGLVGWLPPRLPTSPATQGPASPDGWSGGVDNRVLLTSTTSWPWRTIVHFSNNCSGALVGPRHILTAAHCINQRGTNNWYSFTVSPGRNGASKPYGDSAMNPNPQPGDPFRWYFTPSQWRSSQYNSTNCAGSCYAASEWDWGIIVIPEHLGYQTGWMGYVARPAGRLNVQSHFNRGYPWCGTSKGNEPDGDDCVDNSLYGDTNLCAMGNYLFPGPDNWNRVIRNSCDISGGHSGSPIYHYFYDAQIAKVVPVASMVVIWEHCYTCGPGDATPNSARRLTPNDLGIISFFRQWKP